MPNITNCLWFDDNGEEAAEFYTHVFPNSKITEVIYSGPGGPGPEHAPLTVSFELDGTPYLALNGGKVEFAFNESISFQVFCTDQDEVDYYWNALTDGGEPGPCGWLKDKYGLSWQIVPNRLMELEADPDPEKAQRAVTAMLQMSKIDIAELERAATGS